MNAAATGAEQYESVVVVKKRRKQIKKRMKLIPFLYFSRETGLCKILLSSQGQQENAATLNQALPVIPRQLGEEGGPQHESPQCPSPVLTSHQIHHEPSGACRAQATSSPPRCNQHMSHLGEQATRVFPVMDSICPSAFPTVWLLITLGGNPTRSSKDGTHTHSP